MKTVFVMVMALAVAVVSGCTSPRGGGMSSDEGFKVAAPTLTTEIKQGDRQTVTVSLKRDKYFKQDVTLRSTASKGLSVDPLKVVVKAGDSPDVQFQIKAPKDAALGEYKIIVRATPESGTETSTDITVKVVAPQP
jgi:uncharacterized membrane protein